jgi:c-di-GMP-binding flagellar brake protein YcgR
MQSTASQLLGVAARSAARLLVQLHARVGEGSFKRVAQTANISETGMLLSGAPELPLKSKLELEFELPGDSRPIQAIAEVVRHASPEVENLTGIGVRFIEMSSEAAERLQDFLEVRLGQRAGDQSSDDDLDLDAAAPSVGG